MGFHSWHPHEGLSDIHVTRDRYTPLFPTARKDTRQKLIKKAQAVLKMAKPNLKVPRMIKFKLHSGKLQIRHPVRRSLLGIVLDTNNVIDSVISFAKAPFTEPFSAFQAAADRYHSETSN